MDGFTIKSLRDGDGQAIAAIDGGNGWNRAASLWDGYLDDQDEGRREVVIAWQCDRPVGYATLLWSSGYAPIREADIPEINNIAVAAQMRGQGVATAMIAELERRAARAGKTAIGIGVGLYADYGAAQRLYVGLGYVPDGRGLMYEDQPVEVGSRVEVDDDLILRLVKQL